MSDPKLARRMSGSSASPYKTDIYVDDAGRAMAEENGQPASSEASKSTGSLTVGECLKLARQLQDTTALPAACREYIDKQALLKKAYEGMGSNAAARASHGGLTHAQLQRRWTSRRDPLAGKK